MNEIDEVESGGIPSIRSPVITDGTIRQVTRSIGASKGSLSSKIRQLAFRFLPAKRTVTEARIKTARILHVLLDGKNSGALPDILVSGGTSISMRKTVFDRELQKKTLAEYELDGLPVFDGIVAARNRLFVSLQNGKLACFGKETR